MNFTNAIKQHEKDPGLSKLIISTELIVNESIDDICRGLRRLGACERSIRNMSEFVIPDIDLNKEVLESYCEDPLLAILKNKPYAQDLAWLIIRLQDWVNIPILQAFLLKQYVNIIEKTVIPAAQFHLKMEPPTFNGFIEFDFDACDEFLSLVGERAIERQLAIYNCNATQFEHSSYGVIREMLKILPSPYVIHAMSYRSNISAFTFSSVMWSLVGTLSFVHFIPINDVNVDFGNNLLSSIGCERLVAKFREENKL